MWFVNENMRSVNEKRIPALNSFCYGAKDAHV